jgi:hypothetical protein
MLTEGGPVSFLAGLGKAIDEWSNLALSVISDYVGWRGFFKAVREGRINPSGELPDHAFERLHQPSQAAAITKLSCRLVYYLRRFDLDTSDVKRLGRWLVRWSSDPLSNCDKLPPPRELEAIGYQVLTELRSAFDKLSQTEPQQTPAATGGDVPRPTAAPQPQANSEEAVNVDQNAWRATISIYSGGVADDRLRQVAAIVAQRELSVAERLQKIDDVLPIPASASLKDLAELFGVSREAVRTTPWWQKSRAGERELKTHQRRQRLQQRAKLCPPDPDRD